MRMSDGSSDVCSSDLLTARLIPPNHKRRTVEQIRVAMREALAPLPGARVSIGRGTPGEKMTLMLAGSDPVLLTRSARAVEADLRTLHGIGPRESPANLLRPTIVITPHLPPADGTRTPSAPTAPRACRCRKHED